MSILFMSCTGPTHVASFVSTFHGNELFSKPIS